MMAKRSGTSGNPHPRRLPESTSRAAITFAAVAILVFAILTVWLWSTAPDTLPSHFGADGQPDAWSSKTSTFAILVPIGLLLPLAFTVRRLWEKLPLAFVNIPNKEYWVEHGETTYLYDCLMVFMRVTAGAMALLMCTIVVQIVRTAGGSTPGWMVWVPTIGFLVVIGAALVFIVSRLTPPRD